MKRFVAGSLLQVKLFLMPFTRDVATDSRSMAAMHAQLRLCARTRAFLCTSREHRLSLELKAQVPPPNWQLQHATVPARPMRVAGMHAPLWQPNTQNICM